MKGNLRNLALGVTGSTLLALGGSAGLAIEHAISDHLKVKFEADVAGVGFHSPLAVFAFPDGSGLTTSSAVNKASATIATELGLSDEADISKLQGELKSILDKVSMSAIQELGLTGRAGFSVAVTHDYSDQVDVIIAAEMKNLNTAMLKDPITAWKGKVPAVCGTVLCEPFLSRFNATMSWKFSHSIITPFIDTHGMLELTGGIIKSVFQRVLPSMAKLHAYSDASLNSVPYGIVNTDRVRDSFFGLAAYYSFSDWLTVGATFKPLRGVPDVSGAKKASPLSLLKDSAEYGFATAIRFGEPRLMVDVGVAFASELPYNLHQTSYAEGLGKTPKIFSFAFGFQRAGAEFSAAYRYRTSEGVDNPKLGVSIVEVTGDKRVPKVERFYMHDLEIGLTIKPAELDFVVSEEVKHWEFGFKLLVMFDSSELKSGNCQGIVDAASAADRMVFSSQPADHFNCPTTVAGDGGNFQTYYGLGIVEYPAAFQLDISAQRKFGEDVRIFGGLRLTYDQGVSRWKNYVFSVEKTGTNDDYRLKLNLPENKRNVVLNRLSPALYAGAQFYFR